MSVGEVSGKASLICDRLPSSITVGGISYKLITDFRRWILFTELLETELDGLTVADCAAMLVCPAIRSALRKDRSLAEEFIREAGCFALCGDALFTSENNAKHAQSSSKNMPVFDFEIDSERIFASFMAVYGIDLNEINMHWWKFMALLRCLPRDCAFMQTVELRSIDVTKIADDGLRKQLRRARAAVRLPKREQIQNNSNKP